MRPFLRNELKAGEVSSAHISFDEADETKVSGAFFLSFSFFLSFFLAVRFLHGLVLLLFWQMKANAAVNENISVFMFCLLRYRECALDGPGIGPGTNAMYWLLIEVVLSRGRAGHTAAALEKWTKCITQAFPFTKPVTESSTSTLAFESIHFFFLGVPTLNL